MVWWWKYQIETQVIPTMQHCVVFFYPDLCKIHPMSFIIVATVANWCLTLVGWQVIRPMKYLAPAVRKGFHRKSVCGGGEPACNPRDYENIKRRNKSREWCVYNRELMEIQVINTLHLPETEITRYSDCASWIHNAFDVAVVCSQEQILRAEWNDFGSLQQRNQGGWGAVFGSQSLPNNFTQQSYGR